MTSFDLTLNQSLGSSDFLIYAHTGLLIIDKQFYLSIWCRKKNFKITDIYTGVSSEHSPSGPKQEWKKTPRNYKKEDKILDL